MPANSTDNLKSAIPDGSAPPSDVPMPITLTPEQVNAAGMADATPGTTWTLSITVGTKDDQGASFTIDNAEQEGAGDMDTPQAEVGEAKGMPKVRASMKPVGPDDLGM
jgi:hypothetical protein